MTLRELMIQCGKKGLVAQIIPCIDAEVAIMVQPYEDWREDVQDTGIALTLASLEDANETVMDAVISSNFQRYIDRAVEKYRKQT